MRFKLPEKDFGGGEDNRLCFPPARYPSLVLWECGVDDTASLSDHEGMDAIVAPSVSVSGLLLDCCGADTLHRSAFSAGTVLVLGKLEPAERTGYRKYNNVSAGRTAGISDAGMESGSSVISWLGYDRSPTIDISTRPV